tara:strand:- start:394 stop:795 length:402 start_codon:yes stop_codon:yes gene_type:complete
MPYYDKECKNCKHLFEHFAKIKERNNFAACPLCGSASITQISAPNVITTKEFICQHIDGTNKTIKSKRHMRDVLKEHNERTGDNLSSTWVDGGIGKNPGTPKPIRELEEFRRRKKLAKSKGVNIEKIPAKKVT